MSNLVQAAGVFNITVPEWMEDDTCVGKIAGVKIYVGELRRLNKAIADKEETEFYAEGAIRQDYSRQHAYALNSALSTEDNYILSLLRERKIIDAIKYRRKVSGEGLKQAKDYVESFAVQHGLRKKAPSQFYPHTEIMTWA